MNKTSVDLQEVAAKAALAAGNVDPSMIDSVVVGNVIAVRKQLIFALLSA